MGGYGQLKIRVTYLSLGGIEDAQNEYRSQRRVFRHFILVFCYLRPCCGPKLAVTKTFRLRPRKPLLGTRSGPEPLFYKQKTPLRASLVYSHILACLGQKIKCWRKRSQSGGVGV